MHDCRARCPGRQGQRGAENLRIGTEFFPRAVRPKPRAQVRRKRARYAHGQAGRASARRRAGADTTNTVPPVPGSWIEVAKQPYPMVTVGGNNGELYEMSSSGEPTCADIRAEDARACPLHGRYRRPCCWEGDHI